MEGLRGALDKIENASKKGLIKGGLLVLRESQKTVPVDLGNLRASGYVLWDSSSSGTKKQFRSERGKKKVPKETVTRLMNDRQKIISEHQAALRLAAKKKVIVEIGYTAYYAVFVHEDIDARHTKGQRAKYLQQAIQENSRRIYRIVAQEAKKAS